MAQGKIYRNSSNLTTPPAIQGPEVSATWRRTCRGEVLMTVWMPLDTVDSEVYVKTPRGHSAVTMEPPGLHPPGGSLGINTTPPTR